jgi:hypothetical protein
MESNDNNERDEIFSKVVRAGKRTYFFDVKSTKSDDFYLTVTESKRRYTDDGKFNYEKHKLFLYKEDFEKFSEGLNEAIDKIKNLKKDQGEEVVEKRRDEFSDVNFEDLGDDN